MIRRLFSKTEFIRSVAPDALFAIPRRWFARGLGTFPAFEDRNYRIYFIGQVISLAGSWVQVVAQGWLVFELTHSAFYVGFVSALSSLPVLFLGLFAGVIVDRFDVKKILYATQILPMIFAAILGVLTLMGAATIGSISVLAFLLGMVNALDVPARQTFVARMTERRHLASAIVLNAAAFNGSRVIGPSLAGVLIALVGVGGAFLVNAVSFAAVIVSLIFITHSFAAPGGRHPHPLAALKEGLVYTFSRAELRFIMIVTAVGSVFGWSYAAILPVIAGAVFRRDAAGLGSLYTAVGLGALTATLLISLFLKRAGPRPFIIGGNILLALSLVAFSLSADFTFGLAMMFLTGLALIAQFSVMNSVVQHAIDDRIRGRVMSIYVVMLRGMFPFGAFLIGWLGDRIGAQAGLRLMALPVAVSAAALLASRRLIPRRLNDGSHHHQSAAGAQKPSVVS